MALSRKQLVSLIFYRTGICHLRLALFRIKKKPVTFFTIFHDIHPAQKQLFESKLVYLKKNTNVIDINDFLKGVTSQNKINVVITFDDGYKGWIDTAIPLLLKHDLKATFFISSGLIDIPKYKEDEILKKKLFVKLGFRQHTGCLEKKDIVSIFKNGFTIGGHTVNHCILGEEPNVDKLWYEIVEDKKILERILNQQLKYFSYPSGSYIHPTGINIKNIVRAAGYYAAVTTKSGINFPSTDKFRLHREFTNVEIDDIFFKAIISGSNTLIKRFKEIYRGKTD